MVFHRCLVNWRRGALVYVHAAICETFLVSWYPMNLWSIGGGSIYHGYIYIPLYVKPIGCNSVAWMYGQLQGCLSAMGICAFFTMCNLLGVMVFHTSMVIWSGGYLWPKYMCILVYVKLLWCSGIP